MAQVSDREFGSAHVSEDPKPREYSARLGDLPMRVGEALRLRDIPKAQIVAIAVLSLVALVAGIVLVWGGLTSRERVFTSGRVLMESGTESTQVADSFGDDGIASDDVNKDICIYVAGEVFSPGIYYLDPTARVADAIAAAGGITSDAELNTLNLAQRVSDGQKVYVPKVGEAAMAAVQTSSSSTLVNLNTAGIDELQTLPGIGQVTAQAIIDDREANGPYASVGEVVRVSGIGEKTLAKFAPKACV